MPRRSRRRAAPGPVRRRLGVVADTVAHLASIVWRSLFGTAAALCVVAGLMKAIGREADSYGFVLVAMVIATIATFTAILALRVETDPDPYDLEVTP